MGDGDGSNSGSDSGGGDVYSLLSLLRRMLLWPVTAELLRTTAAGKQVSALKQHPNAQVSALAEHVVHTWRASLAQQAMAAAAAKAARKDHTKKGGKGDSMLAAQEKGGKDGGGPARLAVDEALRVKVVSMLRDAMLDHRRTVLADKPQEKQQQQQEEGTAEPAPSNSKKQDAPKQQQQQQQEAQLSEERPKLQLLAEALEAGVQQFILQQQQQAQQPASTATTLATGGGSGGPSTLSSSAADLLQAYKTRVRMLCTGLRYPDGVSADLIAGHRRAQEVGVGVCVGWWRLPAGGPAAGGAVAVCVQTG